jgi:hypothetical protein
MRLVSGSIVAVTIAISTALAAPVSLTAQAPAQQDAGAIAVKNGGITAPGWMGKIDAQEEKAGQVLNNSALSLEAGKLHVRTGPAVTYWNPANKATGNYTVKATFTESNYMGLNDHPHPYGIVIAGNDMGTDQMSLLYCSAYGDGTFIVRGFGPASFALGGRRPTANAAVNKAAGKGSPVTQVIAMSVTADSISCSINGTVVGTFPKTDAVGAGKLKSTDGVYGIRFAHNTEALVSGLTISKQ